MSAAVSSLAQPELEADASTGGITSLAEFNAALIRTAADLAGLVSVAEVLSAPEAAQALSRQLDQLASGAFVVAIIGEFKRGKSTLANALLGAEIMPSDVLPTTAAVNRVVYGRKPAVTLKLRDGSRRVLAIEELLNHVTKLDDESATRAAAIEEAVIAFPTHLCRHNVELIDTPGLGDEAAMTERTAHAIQSTDAAIMVTSALAPFAQSEADILEVLLEYVPANRLFFVVGQIDLVPAEAVPRIVALIERRVRQVLGEAAGPLRIFPVSAREALYGKLEHDPARLQLSRFEAFETELEQFLARDRGTTVMQGANRALVTLGRQLAHTARGQLERLEDEEKAEVIELMAREAALEQLRQSAATNLAGFRQRADQVQASGTWYSEQLGNSLLHTARSALEQVVFDEAAVTDAARRHHLVAQAVAPFLHAVVEEHVRNILQELTHWADHELAALAALKAELETLLEEGAGTTDGAGDPELAAPTAVSSPEVGAEPLQSAAGVGLLGDSKAPILEMPAAFSFNFAPSSLSGSVRSLMGEVAGIDVVKRTWLGFQGSGGQKLLCERTNMMAGLLRQDYSKHFDQALPIAVHNVAAQSRFDNAFGQLTEKLFLKLQGETALLEKICEIRPWQLRLGRQWARAERQREVERSNHAFDNAERSRLAASARLEVLDRLLNEAPGVTHGESEA